MREHGYEYHEGLVDSSDLTTSMEALHLLGHDVQLGFSSVATLEDLVVGLESIHAATATELFLAESAIRGVTSGLGMEAYGLTHDLAQYQGKAISTEGVVEFIKKLWQVIWSAVKRLFAAAMKVATLISNSLPMTLRAFDQLAAEIKRLEKKGGGIKDPITFYGDAAELLMLGDTVPANAVQFQLELEKLQDRWEHLSNVWINKAFTVGQRFIEDTTKAEVKDIPDLLRKVNTHAVTLQAEIPNIVKHSGPLLGNRQLSATADKQRLSGPVGLGDTLQSMKVNLVESPFKVNVVALQNSATLSTPTLEELSAVLSSARSLLLQMNAHFTGNRNRQLDQWLKDMGRSMDALSSEYDLRNAAGAHSAMRDELNVLMQYVPTFGRWVTDGQLEYSLHAARVCRAVGRVVKQSLSNYE